MKFLVLESYKDNLKKLKVILEEMGSVKDHHMFDDSLDGIDNIFSKQEKYDYYFIDLDMQENSGIKLLRTIRKKEQQYEMTIKKVFIVTDDENTSKLLNCFSTKTDIFINKEISKQDLMKIIK